MKLATWNVNSLNARLPHLLRWLGDSRVDLLGLQELKLTDDKFPRDDLLAEGYEAESFGQKTYNGVALLAGGQLRDVQRNIPGFDDEQARVIAATTDSPLGELRVINAYFVNGQEPGSDKFAYKMRWLSALTAWVRAELARHPRVRIDLDREVGREALIRTPFVNGADQVGLGGQHGCAEAFSARKGDAPSGASSFPSASARR